MAVARGTSRADTGAMGKQDGNVGIGQALRRLREARGITGQTVADFLGINKSGVTRMEAGQTPVTTERVDQLARLFNVQPIDVYKLATGEYQDDDVVQAYKVPRINWTQAGNWAAVMDNLAPGQGERVATTWKARAHTFALRVRGDSMEPRFPEGCVIIVEPEIEAKHGDFVIVRQNGDEATFKQFVADGSRVYLRPLNPRYPVLEMGNDAVICGVVKRVQMDV